MAKRERKEETSEEHPVTDGEGGEAREGGGPVSDLVRQTDREMRALDRRRANLFSETAVDWTRAFPLVHGWNPSGPQAGPPSLEPFGGPQDTGDGWHQPRLHHQVDEENDRVVVTAELPGVARTDIRVGVRGDAIRIRTENEDPRYRGTLILPVALDGARADARFADGVLRIEAPILRHMDETAHDVPVR